MEKLEELSSDNSANNISLTKNVTWYGLGNITIRALSFILLPIYSNLLSATEFGNYALLMSVYSIIAVLYQFGTQNVLNKFYIESSNEDERKVIVSSILNSLVILGISLTLLFSLTSSYMSDLIFGSSSFAWLLSMIFSSVFFESTSTFILSFLKAKEFAKKSVYYSFAAAIGNFVLNIVLVVVLNLSVAGIILAQLISNLLLLLIIISTIKDEYVFKINMPVLKKIFKFSLPLAVSNLFTSGVNYGDRFLLNIFIGTQEVGLYSFSYRIAMIMNVFAMSFGTAWGPRSINKYHENDYSNYYGIVLTKLIALSGGILLAVSLFAGYLFEIQIFNVSLFNKAYSAGLIILPFILFGYIFNTISVFFSVYPFISNKSYHLLLADLIALTVNILINIILIPTFGIIGSAIATAIAFLANAVYLFAISRNKIKIKYPKRELFIIIIAILISLALGTIWKNVVISMAILILYFIVLNFVVKLKIKDLFRFKLVPLQS